MTAQCGNEAHLRLSRTGKNWRSIDTSDSGSRWTRFETRTIWKSSGYPGRLPGKPGDIALQAFANSYNGKRVVVTGHTGFKGAWLCEWLLALRAEVIGISLAPP